MTIRNKLIFLPVLLGALLTGCAGPKGRIKDPGEEDLVGESRAGGATFDRLAQGAMNDLLNKYTDEVLGGATPAGLNVAFAGVFNKQSEEIGDWRDDLNQILDSAINDYPGFSTVSQRYVAVGLREIGGSVDDLFLPAKRRRFFEVLEVNSGNPVKALVFATITGGNTVQGDLRQKRYRLSLDMVDSETGKNLKGDAKLEKEYR